MRISAVSCAKTLFVQEALHTAAVAAADVPKNCRREIVMILPSFCVESDIVSRKGASRKEEILATKITKNTKEE